VERFEDYAVYLRKFGGRVTDRRPLGRTDDHNLWLFLRDQGDDLFANPCD